MIRCVACGEVVGEDFHTRGEAACCNKVPQLSLGYQIHSWNTLWLCRLLQHHHFFTLQPFSATWNLLSAVMDVVARSPAIIFRFHLFLIVTHNVTLILFCSSIMILNLFSVSLYFWRKIFIRWTIYSSIQSVWGARSVKRSIALTTQYLLCYITCGSRFF